tara:strand:+ start:5420 stop:5785 length:366 start_codon:yes stop_codon:yes gene_type:complete
MTTKKKRITPEEERHIEHLHFEEGRSISNIVKTQNLEWGIGVIRRVVKEGKQRRWEEESEHRAIAVLTDKEWADMIYGNTRYPSKWDKELTVSLAKRAELKELRAIRKLLETLVESKEVMT